MGWRRMVERDYLFEMWECDHNGPRGCRSLATWIHERTDPGGQKVGTQLMCDEHIHTKNVLS